MKTVKDKGCNGKRGRPAGERMPARRITADNQTWETLKGLGGGNFSRGIRAAAALVAERNGRGER